MSVTAMATTCPPFCSLRPGHDWDSVHDDGRLSRGHGGPQFGAFLEAGADEFEDAPGVLLHVVQMNAESENITNPTELRRLATAALAAAEWLEAHA